jgi:putative hydrolase of the HAD superfamily
MEMTVTWPKAILIDLDDTVISFDVGVDLDRCWMRALRTHLPEVGDETLAEMVSAIQARAAWYWSDPERHRIGRRDPVSARQEIVAAALAKWDVRDPVLARTIAADYGEARERQVRLFPGALEAIGLFRSKGVRLALITNGNAEMQRAKIRRFDLAGLFDDILIEGEVGVGKPEAGIYLLALERLGASAEDAWMIGDNYEWEIAAPGRLGIRGVWIDHYGAGVPEDAPVKPFLTVRSWGELLALFRSERAFEQGGSPG